MTNNTQSSTSGPLEQPSGTLLENYSLFMDAQKKAHERANQTGKAFDRIIKQIHEYPDQLDKSTVQEFKSFVTELEKNPEASFAKESKPTALKCGYEAMAMLAKHRPEFVGPEWIEGIIDSATKEGGERKETLRFAQFHAVKTYAEARCGQVSEEGFGKLMKYMFDRNGFRSYILSDMNPVAHAVIALVKPSNLGCPDPVPGNRYTCISFVTPEQARQISAVPDERPWGTASIDRLKEEIYYQREDLRECIGDFNASYSGGKRASALIPQKEKELEEIRKEVETYHNKVPQTPTGQKNQFKGLLSALVK